MYEAPDGELSSWKHKVVLILINIFYKMALDQGLFFHLHKTLFLENFLTISTPEEKLVGVYTWLGYFLSSLWDWCYTWEYLSCARNLKPPIT
jgi:hypothetical protein